ncbi:hypothetical protein MAM1_0073d04247 [Mucor ambiguus]|uniref:Uncharacterized protein n=1 Tax=Mucor ambiguus TaxID=91626 RepID=A0A0C9MNK6_9FUNG|nr:hypothetical protein MAM1_0073d04247 [Mucor ambiguus]
MSMIDSWWCFIVGDSVLFTAVAVYLLYWCLGARCCCDCRSLAVMVVGAVYCCCCLLVTTVLVMHYSFGKSVLFTPAVAVYLPLWCLLEDRFCCCCRSFVVLVMIYRISLVLSAADSIYCWLSWRSLLLVRLFGTFGLYYVVWMCLSLKLNITLSEAGGR